jgi:hypothetical protein
MTRSRRLLGLLGAVSAFLAVIAIWLVLHNPQVDNTSLGDDQPCAAPYDTVLNHPDNVPGGEPLPMLRSRLGASIWGSPLQFWTSSRCRSHGARAGMTAVLAVRAGPPKVAGPDVLARGPSRR